MVSARTAIRRRLNPELRRRELLDAAVRELRERGPVDCRVEDITTAAGTAKGNFYRYFPTWDDLLVAVRDHLVDRYADEVEQRFAGRTNVDWWRVLEEEVERFVDFQLGLGLLHDAVFHGPVSGARPIANGRSAPTVIAGFLAQGIAAGAFADVDVDLVAVLTFHMLHGAADEVRAGADRDAMHNAVLHMLERTLTKEPIPR
jgi:AcrR family transcriptional regulator